MTTFGTLTKDGTVTNKMEVDLNKVPSTDPLAFMYGVHKGRNPNRDRYGDIDHGSLFSELAPEYLRGFLLGYKGILVAEGTKFRKGNEQSLFFFDKNIRPK